MKFHVNFHSEDVPRISPLFGGGVIKERGREDFKNGRPVELKQ